MTNEAYRYEFNEEVPIEEAEASLVLAIFAAESLHGEATVRLDVAHHFDVEKRACVIDAGTSAGKDLNRLFVGFLRREFGANGFSVERITASEQPAPAHEPAGVC